MIHVNIIFDIDNANLRMNIHTPNYKKPFTQFVKKQPRPFQSVIEDEVLNICREPELGEQKKGDLAEIRVHKFKYQRQEYLIAYRYLPERTDEALQILLIDFYKIGTHENFYAELKKYLASE